MARNTLILIALSVAIIGGLIFLGLSNRGAQPMGQDSRDKMGSESIEMGIDMMRSMMVSSDREFIEGMIPHHQEAIDTANEVLERGGEIPEVKELAMAIVKTQEEEIQSMRGWYKEWFGVEYQDTGTYMKMMRDLTPYSGKELDAIFVENMIMHHMGALMMAQQALEFSEREEILTLADNILETQKMEIELMLGILDAVQQ